MELADLLELNIKRRLIKSKKANIKMMIWMAMEESFTLMAVTTLTFWKIINTTEKENLSEKMESSMMGYGSKMNYKIDQFQ